MAYVSPYHVGSSWIRDQTHVPCMAVRVLITRPPGKPPIAFLPLAFDEKPDVHHVIVSSLAALNMFLFDTNSLTILCFCVYICIYPI